MTGGGLAERWLLPFTTFAACVLPVTTHRSPGVAGYLWCALVLALSSGVLAGRHMGAPHGPAARHVTLAAAAPFALVLGWGAVTLLWSSAPSRIIALVTLALSALALAAPALAVGLVDDNRLDALLWRVCAAAVLGSMINGLVYTLRPGHRLTVPLGSASALHLPLTLCLAVLIGAALVTKGPWRVAWGVLAGLAGLLTLAADSRAGTLALVVLIWLAVVRHARRGAQAVVVGMGTAVLGTLVLIGYLRWERPDAGLGDQSRWTNHVHGLRAWADGGWGILPGRGSGSVWPWMSVELGQVASQPGGFTIGSPWGPLLWHPHSTLLGVLVELGPVALLGVLVTLGVVIGASLVVLRDPSPTRWLPAAALIATAPGMLLETYLFRGFPAALVWWTVALAVVRRGGQLVTRWVSGRRRP